MARRLPEVPKWALALMVAALLALGVMIPMQIAKTNRQEEAVAQAREAQAATRTDEAGAPANGLDPLRADGDLSIYYIGESITDGYNASSQAQGFRTVLSSRLGEEGPVTETADYRAAGTLREVMDLATLPAAVDVAVIELGTEDALPAAGTDPGTFRSDYEQLAQALGGASEKLVCLGVYRGGEFADELDSVIQEVCAANGGSFIQTQDLFTTNAFVAAEGFPAYPRVGDGGHPNDDGHAAMAGRILRTLTGA